MNLYEINEEMLNCIDAETGEVDTDKLDELTMLRDEKLENIALWIKDLKAEAEALKAEKLAFQARQAAAENKAESLKNYLTGFLHGEKFKTTKCVISFRRSEKVEILNELDLPPEFTTVEIKADKTAIKQAIKNGQEVAGAYLVESTSCIIK
jgi:hypothetical protein